MFRACILLVLFPFGIVNTMELVDPTRPSFLLDRNATSETSNTEEEVKLPKLQAIFSSMNERSVLLDGRRLKVGDLVSGYEVQDIERKAVTLMKNDEMFTIKLSTASVKQRVGDDQ